MSVYNGERHLREAMDSILNQTFTDFEFIIINDGSTDKTPEILAQYSDPRVKVMNQENTGLTKSLNKAIKISNGEYIARMDADDISLPTRLELEVKFLDNHEDVGLVGTTYCHIDESGKILSIIPVPIENEIIQKELVKSNCFAHSSIMVRKTVLDKVRYYREEFLHAQDYDLLLRVAEYYNLHNLEEALHYWRVVDEGITIKKYSQQNKYADLARRLAKKRRIGLNENIKEEINKLNFNEDKFDETNSNLETKKLLASHFHLYGIICISQAKKIESRRHFLTSIKYYPLRIRPYIFFCLTFFPLKLTKILRFLKKRCDMLFHRNVFI